MSELNTTIEVKGEDIRRPTDRPVKSNWRIEMVKKALGVLQYASPSKSAEIIWHYFTMPGKAKFTKNQLSLINNAETFFYTYRGDRIIGYRWGSGAKKVLLCHGWRSKTADFRKMIEAFLELGYTIEGIDLRAHGKSAGEHTALPEYKEIVKNHYAEHGPYESVIGYSLGGLAAGMALSELSKSFHPKNFFVIAAPPYVTYFFEEIIESIGLKKQIYEAFKELVEKRYYQKAEYFDLRDKYELLKEINRYILHCEDDQVVPFEKSQDLNESWSNTRFVRIKGLGHYKVISNDRVINYIGTAMAST